MGEEIAVIGASKGTGLQCVLLLARKKIPCRAICRDTKVCQAAVNYALPPPQRKLVKVVQADVTEPSTLPDAVNGCSGVIFTATASAWWRLPFQESTDTPPHVDYHGAVAAATASAAAGVQRFVLVSSLAVTRPSDMMHISRNSLCGRIMDWKLLGEQGATKVIEAVASSASADVSLTVIRPGILTDDAPCGPGGVLVDTGDTLSGSISRTDVAALCVEALFNRDAQGLVFECVNGRQGGNYPTCSNFEQIFASLRHGHLPVTTPGCLTTQNLGITALCGVPLSDQCTS